MKQANKLLDFINIVFLITNVWIVCFTSLVDFLNYKFPASVSEQYFRPEAVFPEPFEIRLYLILTFLTIILIWRLRDLFHNVFSLLEKKIQKKYVLYVKLILSAFLISLFIMKLGPYPLSYDPHPYLPHSSWLDYTRNFILIAIVIFTVYVELYIFTKLFKKKSFFIPVLYTLLIILTAILTFEPKFPISAGDYAFFLGPISEISHGKTIYTNIPSQYGFIPILFFAFLKKINLFPLAFIQIFIWAMYIAQYFLCFYLLYKFTKSQFLALTGYFSIVVINYYSYIHSPQNGPMRWLIFFLCILSCYKLKKIDSKRFLFLLAFLSLWFIDVGVSMILAYLLTLFTLILSKKVSIKQAVMSSIYLATYYLGIILVISLSHVLLGMNPIDISEQFFSLKKHAMAGLVMVPINFQSYFWLVMLAYFAALIIFFRNKITDTHHVPFILSANFMALASLYFVGRSVDPNLFHIGIFFVFLAIQIVGRVSEYIYPSRVRILFLIIIYLLFVLLPIYQRKEFISEFFTDKYRKIQMGEIFTPEIDGLLFSKYNAEVELIKKHLTDKEVVILSTDDTYLFTLSSKRNLIDANPQSGIDSESEMNLALQRATVVCPQKIAVDCFTLGKCVEYETYSKLFHVAPTILLEIQKKCKATYEATICTDKLCIADKKISQTQ